MAEIKVLIEQVTGRWSYDKTACCFGICNWGFGKS